VTELSIVGLAEAAELLDVPLATIMGWHARGLLPTPDAELASGPIWWCSTIQQWEAPRHHDLTGGMQGPSPKWLDHYTSIRETRGDPPAEVAAWRKEVIAKYPTLQAHRLER
jgi:hypothetical protein